MSSRKKQNGWIYLLLMLLVGLATWWLWKSHSNVIANALALGQPPSTPIPTIQAPIATTLEAPL